VSLGPTLSVVTVADSREALEKELATLRGGSGTVALVPTMGALHEGHLTLIDRAKELADSVAVSVFVNRLQFGPNEDFRTYPRALERDVRLATERGARLVFAPDETVMYPRATPDIQVEPGRLGDRLCGAFRPGHFRGVLTVVAKLFGLLRPDVAIFGRKDYQQALLIRRMVEDLDLGVRIEVAPTVREHDGLALSSRNAYLSAPERADALGLWRALDAADRLFRGGEVRSQSLLAAFQERIAAHAHLAPQYVEIVHPDTLTPLESAVPGAVMAAAVFCGSTRLIDNVVFGAAADPRIAVGSRA
jgi:pantoate--beta-alanine ligase